MKTDNKKLRLLLTTKCPNKCPMCCNNSWDFSKLPVVERWNYEQIMFTGGEPLLFPARVSNFANSVKEIVKVQYGYTPKIYVYTAVCDSLQLCLGLKHLDGVVLTPHNRSDVNKFLAFNDSLLNNPYYKGFEEKSLRLNLFKNIKEMIPEGTDLSLWQVKDMEWVKDCPVPEGEDFRRISSLW